MLVMFKPLKNALKFSNNNMKCRHNLDCHLLHFFFFFGKNRAKIKAIMNSTIEPVNEKSHCVFSIIAQCCKINGFDKTSQSLSLCSPVETFTLLGAVITASVSTLRQREEQGFPERSKKKEKEKLAPEKIEGRGLRKTKKEKKTRNSLGSLCCISLSQTIAICTLGLEKSDFHTSGILNLSSVTNGFKRDREVLQRTT